MTVNEAKHHITVLEEALNKGSLVKMPSSLVKMSLDEALHCMTLVQNLETIYHMTRDKVVKEFTYTDIIDKFFERDGELC